jgi:hypothetical protein
MPWHCSKPEASSRASYCITILASRNILLYQDTSVVTIRSRILKVLAANLVHDTDYTVREFPVQRSGFDSRRYQIFREVVGLERDRLSLVNATDDLLGRKSGRSGLDNREYGRRGSAAMTTQHPSIRKS